MAADNRVGMQVALDSLLAFLRIKGGQGPNALKLDLDPSLDVTDFYGAQSLTAAQENVIGNSAATFLSTIATQPRRYIAVSASLTVGAAGGTVQSISVGFRLNTTSTVNTYWAVNGPFAATIGQVYRVGADVRGVILPAGHQIVARIDGNAAGADHNLNLEYTYQRLDGLP